MLKKRPQKTLISEAIEADKERPVSATHKEEVERMDRVRRRIDTRTHLVFLWSLLGVVGIVAAIVFLVFLLRVL